MKQTNNIIYKYYNITYIIFGLHITSNTNKQLDYLNYVRIYTSLIILIIDQQNTI